MTSVDVDVILPVLDEREALPWVLRRLPEGFRPIVPDNGSTDGSAQLARALGARVVVEPQRGLGAACYAGLRAARADVVCFMDCDGSLDPPARPRLAGPVRADQAALVRGAHRAQAGAVPRHAQCPNRVLVRELARR